MWEGGGDMDKFEVMKPI